MIGIGELIVIGAVVVVAAIVLGFVFHVLSRARGSSGGSYGSYMQGGAPPDYAELRARVSRLEKKVDAMAGELGLEGGEFAAKSGAYPEIEALLSAGQKIEAIKLYRQTNPAMGLKEAKDAVEEIERNMGLG